MTSVGAFARSHAYFDGPKNAWIVDGVEVPQWVCTWHRVSPEIACVLSFRSLLQRHEEFIDRRFGACK
jgi:hypothetical protein